MSFEEKSFVLAHDQARRNAIECVRNAPDGWAVEVKPKKRSLDSSAKFHAICGDVARSGIKFAGKERTATEWKLIFISGHCVATGGKAEFIIGIENEMLDVRERTSKMNVSRMATLIEYVLAWCADNDVRLSYEG